MTAFGNDGGGVLQIGGYPPFADPLDQWLAQVKADDSVMRSIAEGEVEAQAQTVEVEVVDSE